MPKMYFIFQELPLENISPKGKNMKGMSFSLFLTPSPWQLEERLMSFHLKSVYVM